MRDYTGKTIFVGIDVHKKTYAVSVRCQREVVKSFTCEARPEILIGSLLKNFPGAAICSAYEAGYFGYVLHRALKSAGIDNIVVNPASIEVSARDRVKTDKRDAKKIAEQLEHGRLRCIRIPKEEEEQRRSLTRLRSDLVSKRSRVSCQLKSFLTYYGLIDQIQAKTVSLKYLEEAEGLEVTEEISLQIQIYADEWRFHDKQIKLLQKRIEECYQKSEAEAYAICLSAPGVGKTSAGVILSEVGDMSDFSNVKKIGSFSGLTPCEFSSGDHIRQGHISRQGNAQLRRVLNQVAWAAIKKDPSLKEKFDDYAIRMGKKRAITAICRQLLIRLRACLRDGCNYQIQESKREPRTVLDKRTGELTTTSSAA